MNQAATTLTRAEVLQPIFRVFKDLHVEPTGASKSLRLVNLDRFAWRVLQQFDQLRLPEFGLRRGAMACGGLAGRDQVITRALDAFEFTVHDAGLRWVALVVGRVHHQKRGLNFFKIQRWVVVA